MEGAPLDPSRPSYDEPTRPAQPSGQERPQRLYREPEDKKVAGVCSGLADYFGFDPTVVRLGFVVAALVGGFAGVIVGYIIAAVVIPIRPDTVPRIHAPANALSTSPGRNRTLLVGLLVVAALALVGGGWWSWWWFEPPLLGLLLVAAGICLLITRGERPDEEIPTDSATPSDHATTLVDEPEAAGPRDEFPPPIPPWGPAAPSFIPSSGSPYAPGPSRSSTSPQPGGSLVGLFAALLIAAGAVALLTVFDVWDLDLEKGLGVALLVIGIALVVGAWRPRWRPLLLGLGFPTLGLLVLCDVADFPLDGGAGERHVVVSSISELQRLDTTQELLAGELVLDLSDAPLGEPGTPRRLSADVGMGNLEVRLPRDVATELDIEVGIGSSVVDGRNEDGFDVDRTEILDDRPGGGRIELDLYVGFGEVEVTRG